MWNRIVWRWIFLMCPKRNFSDIGLVISSRNHVNGKLRMIIKVEVSQKNDVGVKLICARHCNTSHIRNIKIERSKQLYHNNTLPLFSPLPKLGHGCDVSWPNHSNWSDPTWFFTSLLRIHDFFFFFFFFFCHYLSFLRIRRLTTRVCTHRRIHQYKNTSMSSQMTDRNSAYL